MAEAIQSSGFAVVTVQAMWFPVSMGQFQQPDLESGFD